MEELEPLAKAGREKLNPVYQHEVDERVDALAVDVRSLRPAFDKIRGTSGSVPVLIAGKPGFQTGVKP
jgi:hypothetical protein